MEFNGASKMSKSKNNLAIFEGKKIRRIWDEKKKNGIFQLLILSQCLLNNPSLRKRKVIGQH